MIRRLFTILLLFVSPVWADFKGELYQTTWNVAGEPAQPQPAAPWKPAMWTMGIINSFDSTPMDIRRLASLCKDGGNLKDGIRADTLAYLRQIGRTDIFPGEKVAPHTLIVADFEDQPEPFAEMLCGAVRKQTAIYVQYPGFLKDDGINFGWTSQLREVDFFCIARAWNKQSKLRNVAGDYYLAELYLEKDGDQDAQYRAWTVLLAVARKQMPKAKMLGLVTRGYAWPGAGLMTDAERHRLLRFCLLYDAIWWWGGRDQRIADDLAALADDPLHAFAGEEGWGK